MAISPTQSTNYFDSLPDEKVLEIASYLSIEDVGRFAQVCKRFNAISKDDQFWRSAAQREGIETVDPNLSLSAEVRTYFKIKGKGQGDDLYSIMARILGPTKFDNLPNLPLTKSRKWIDYVSPQEMTSPIMKGVGDYWSRPVILFRYVNRKSRSPEELRVFAVQILYDGGPIWGHKSDHGNNDYTFDGKEGEKILDKVRQVVSYQPIEIMGPNLNPLQAHKLDNGKYALELV